MTYGSKAAERLANKVVFLTGASSGIGAATAKELARVSHGNIRLILTARREDKLKELAEKLYQEYPPIKIHISKLDMASVNLIKPFVSGLPRDFSDVDILINNAGKALGKDEVGEVQDKDLEDMFQTNLLGLMGLTQAVLPIFKKKDAGDIVNIGSIAGRQAYPGGSIYCATKAAVKSITDALRKELISTKIRVLEVDPGAVRTEFSSVRFYGDEDKAKEVYKGTEPLAPEDVAECIVFGVTRKPNTVVAETLLLPTNQASPFHIFKRNEN